MISKLSILPVALIALGGARLASAANYDEGQWVTTFMAGSGFIENGSFNRTMSTTSAGLGTTILDQMQFRDAFRAGPSFGIETGFMAQSNLEPFARLSYSQLRGRNDEIGVVDSPLLSAPTAIRGNFDDMNSWALNLGTRYFLSDTGTMRTYVAGYVGADRTDALHAHIQVAGLAPSTTEELLPQKTRFDAGVEGGLAWQVANNADLSLSVGAQYMDTRSEDTNAFAPLGIDDVRFTDPRWSFPVNLGLDFRF
jgi:hypothetical protein